MQEAQKTEKKTVVEGEMFQAGKVKSHKTKYEQRFVGADDDDLVLE